jgi:hypothetical protein
MKTTVENTSNKKTINSLTHKMSKPGLFIALVFALSCLSSCSIFVGAHSDRHSTGAGVIVNKP